ncbi:MAG: 5-(carboxyamino)imidazole ribonucleotide synthase [bacterium]|nr:5-(carboxyamino)imidazole ribonucleotide synthase [bacterium]MDE0290550.1 5-(carboxyamino)imidazole ribonucleotide synthase [bacterium]MDE0436945.1 5-(carboxyamino)imidazole ribonucleotide synthase [bacterium]
MSQVVAPGATIGIVGGGQLGRMLSFEGHRLGYRVAVLTGGNKDTPGGRVADVEVAAGYDDGLAVQRFVGLSDVITWEFENVEVGLLADLASRANVPVRPGGSIIAAAQHRGRERRALMAAGAPVAAFREVATASGLLRAVADLGPPVIAKRVRFGYDGRGQVRLVSADQTAARHIIETIGEEGLIVEEVVPFDAEISVVVARGVTGEMTHHGVMENVHVSGILDTTVTPPVSVGPDVAAAAVDLAATIAGHLELVGVLCVEMFVTGDELVVNEIAPRPHNSGHCTIEAASTSQFGQQLRAICGLPLGESSCRPAAMVQILGDLWDDPSDRGPAWDEAMIDPGVYLHLYGKDEVRPGRKMGHITCIDSSAERALERAIAARRRLRRW